MTSSDQCRPSTKDLDMSSVRIALANVPVATTPNESVLLATSTIADAGRQGALVVCFPECFIPGYRWPGTTTPPPDPAFLERALSEVARAANDAGITVILGTERLTDRGLQIAACVINPDGTIAGWQEKGAARSVGRRDLPGVRLGTQDLHRRTTDLRRGDLP
jgi:hypothetical protein